MLNEKWEMVEKDPSLISEEYGYYIDVKTEGTPHRIKHDVACVYGPTRELTQKRAALIKNAPLLYDTLRDISNILIKSDAKSVKLAKQKASDIISYFL